MAMTGQNAAVFGSMAIFIYIHIPMKKKPCFNTPLQFQIWTTDITNFNYNCIYDKFRGLYKYAANIE